MEPAMGRNQWSLTGLGKDFAMPTTSLIPLCSRATRPCFNSSRNRLARTLSRVFNMFCWEIGWLAEPLYSSHEYIYIYVIRHYRCMTFSVPSVPPRHRVVHYQVVHMQM